MLRVEAHRSARSACDDGVVLRSVTLGLVLSVLAAACALVEPPREARTIQVEATIRVSMAYIVARGTG